MNIETVAVIVPTLNEENYIERCLQSVSSQSYPKEKILAIVVDSGSSDHTVSLAKKSGAIILNVKRKSIAFSRNKGAYYEKRDIVAFLDADCIADPDWIANAVSILKRKCAVAVGSYPSAIPGESNDLQIAWSKLAGKGFCKETEVDWLPSANLIVRESAFNAVKGFNEKLETCEDVDFCYRIKSQGLVLYDHDVKVYHLREPKTLNALFSKELWHSRSNISGLISHGFKLSEIPSILFPASFGVAVIAILLGSAISIKIVVFGAVSMSMIMASFVFRGYKKEKNIRILIKIYFVYLMARAISFYRELGMIFKYCFKSILNKI